MNQQQINKPAQSFKNFGIIATTVIITALIVGGGVYWWQKLVTKEAVLVTQKRLQQEIDTLKNQITKFQQGNNRISINKEKKVTTDYLMALKAADLFLTACIQRNSEGALNFLSERVKARYSKKDWLIKLSGLSNPHYQAFEIFNGRRIEKNIYEFQVYFYDHYTGQQVEFNREEKPQLLKVVKAQDNRWYIDSLSKRSHSILYIK